MKNKLLYKYKNGNVDVEIYDDGTKIREWPDGEEAWSEYPESCDLKITQYCNMSSVCGYCHEQSNLQGAHGDLEAISQIWSTQKPGTELAIGGGNPLAHPMLKPFLKTMKSFGIIPNVTVNILHMKEYVDMIRDFQEEKLIYGLGISYRGPASLKQLPCVDYRNVVFHMILGIHDLDDCKAVIKWCEDRCIKPKMLLLGYKQYGNGKAFYTPELQVAIDAWKDSYLQELFKANDIVVSFDNLAIAQLDLKNQLDADTWTLLFQGDDGGHTFYVDAVKQEVARTSTSDSRYNYNGSEDIRDLFKKVKL